MPQGPVTKIVLRRPNGRTEIVTRIGHIDPKRAVDGLAHVGNVVAVRHEMMPKGGKHETVGIHDTRR